MLITYHGLHEEEDIQNIWWFQDGAPPHRLRDVTQRQRSVFRPNLVALHQDVEWPARSPDPTPLDFFLWGYLKNKMYATPQRDMQDLRDRIARSLKSCISLCGVAYILFFK